MVTHNIQACSHFKLLEHHQHYKRTPNYIMPQQSSSNVQPLCVTASNAIQPISWPFCHVTCAHGSVMSQFNCGSTVGQLWVIDFILCHNLQNAAHADANKKKMTLASGLTLNTLLQGQQGPSVAAQSRLTALHHLIPHCPIYSVPWVHTKRLISTEL